MVLERRAAVAGGLLVAVLLAGAGAVLWWWTSHDQGLRWPGSGSFGISVPSTRLDQPWAFGEVTLCLTGGVRTAKVLRIRAVKAQGLAVTAFGVRPLDGQFLGASPQALPTAQFTPDRVLVGACNSPSGRTSELGFELRRTQDVDARLDGLLVDWQSGWRRGTVNVPAHVVLCRTARTSSGSCRAL